MNMPNMNKYYMYDGCLYKNDNNGICRYSRLWKEWIGTHIDFTQFTNHELISEEQAFLYIMENEGDPPCNRWNIDHFNA